jgi:WD40 repeat protein
LGPLYNGKYALTSGEEDKTVRLWDIATGQQLRQFTGDLGKTEGVAFSPDDQYVLTGNEDGVARLWRVDFQEVLQFACTALPRDLTTEERAVYGITDNAPTCPKQ